MILFSIILVAVLAMIVYVEVTSGDDPSGPGAV